MKKFIIVSFLFSSLLIQHCQAELGIGLGYPYLGVKYNFSGRYGSEIKWATGDGINVYACRGYWNFYSGEKLKSFVGPEFGYITFDTLDIKGTGYEGALFIGGECFLTKRLSLALDFSPTFIGLESDDFNVSGVEWIANLSLYYYFPTTAQKEQEVKEPVEVSEPVKLTNLAVADFTAKDVSAAESSTVADFLRTALVNIGGFNVVEKANMSKILAEAAFQQTGCTTSECAVQIGKILNVQQMVVGSLSKLMDTFFITVNLVDVETGKILNSENAEAYSAVGLRDACKTLAQKLTH